MMPVRRHSSIVFAIIVFLVSLSMIQIGSADFQGSLKPQERINEDGSCHRTSPTTKDLSSSYLYEYSREMKNGKDYRDEKISKDGTLIGLAHILNDKGNRDLFRNWQGDMNDTQRFLRALEPWILASPVTDLSMPQSAVMKEKGTADVNCANPEYENVLTGQALPEDRQTTIVDFVPFGYDVDKLLLRLVETWDSVDVYVVYEMPFTLLGIAKPLFFPRIREQPRFKQFESKIMYLRGGEYDETCSLANTAAAVRAETAEWIDAKAEYRSHFHLKHSRYGSGKTVGNKGTGFIPKSLYAMMYKFDLDIMRVFKLVPESLDDVEKAGAAGPYYKHDRSDPELLRSIALKRKIMDALRDSERRGGGGGVLGIQNDGDEMVRGKVLAHLKLCERQADVVSVYAPCFSFKNNFFWLQETKDMRHFGSGVRTRSERYKSWKMHFLHNWSKLGHRNRELNHYIWHTGPYLWPLDVMITGGKDHTGSMQRRNYTTNLYAAHHMGYGAAFHMSAVSDPAEVWMKACGTVENVDVCWRSISDAIVEAGKTGTITPEMLFQSSIQPWCNPEHKVSHVDELHPSAKKAVMEAVPNVIRNNPAYFPFMYPTAGLRSTGLFTKCGQKEWVRECD
jgi:hypothetical protein